MAGGGQKKSGPLSPEAVRARQLARYAILVDHFHLTLPEIRKLTDRQIEEVYFHPRTEQGEIKPEVRGNADTLEFRLLGIDMLVANNTITREQGDRLKEEAREKWQTKTSQKHSGQN